MPYTAKQQLDLIKANKLEIIDKINELLGENSGLTWDSSWSQFIAKINEIKTALPIENDQIITEIEHFIANQSIDSIAIASDKIKENAFRQKSSLLTITAPNTTLIGQQAFHNATGLLSIVAPNCTKIENQSFYNSTNLRSVTLSENCTLSNECFYNDIKLETISINNTTTIPSHAFYNCYNLIADETTFPAVKTIGDYAFYNCDKLTNFNFNNVTSIGSYAFNDCDGLTKIDLTGMKGSIGGRAFIYCRHAKEVIIPDTVTSISLYAFRYLDNTCEIYCEHESTPSGWDYRWNYDSYQVYWNAKLRNYTFICNNGDAPIVKNLRCVKPADLPIIERSGYVLDDWYIDAECTTKPKFPYISPTKLTFYAKWVRGYTVILVDYQTLSQLNIGTYYYADFSDMDELFFVNDTYYTNIGAYLDSSCTQLITCLDEIHVPTPILYIKATEASVVNQVYNYDYTGESTTQRLLAGTHIIECWGAQGGEGVPTYNTAYAGMGGYTKGTLTLSNGLTAYIYVGGMGKRGVSERPIVTGGFNGGGNAGYNTNYSQGGGSGGGASDVRLGQDSLYARVIVAAGGGGGGESWQGAYANGGAGGGLIGFSGKPGQNSNVEPGSNNWASPGAGATQTSGGLSGRYSGVYPTPPDNGAFGVGANGIQYSNSNTSGGGGGGGWYGGGAGINGYSQGAGAGGGGSSYTYTAESAINYPNCLLNSNYYLSNVVNLDGTEDFLAPNGIIETGHSGNGYIRINSTYQNPGVLPVECAINLIGVTNNTTVQLKTLSLLHNIYDFTLPTIFPGWLIDKWYIDSDRTIELTYPYEIILNGTLTLYTNIEEHVVYDFEYTGEYEQVTLSAGRYKLECWGAQGGNGAFSDGGHGGYSSGIINLSTDTPIYVFVGGAGSTNNGIKTTNGGFNGGGSARSTMSGNASQVASGGGASDIRINDTSLYARVIVAGGGGGGCGRNYNTTAFSGTVYGFGGGLTACGQTNYNTNNGTATGATQTSGGPATYSNGGTGESGQWGRGGNAPTNTSSYCWSGGGGGWYGGAGGCYDGYAGGGSGYVYTADTYSNYPSGCLLNANYYLTDATTISGNTEITSPSGTLETGHTGNGYVRITKIRSN